MAFDLITVAMFGHPDPAIGGQVRLSGAPAFEAEDFDVHVFTDDTQLGTVLAAVRPHVIFTFGRVEEFPHLLAAPLDGRRRWLHYDGPGPDAATLARTAETVFVDVATRDRFPDEPLVSVFTPAYRTGERIVRPWRSLLEQTYTNWEWVIVDDSPDDTTFGDLSRLADADARIRVFRSDRRCGRIGEVKRRCCGLSRGAFLVELDHDDELTDHCLADLVQAFQTYPDAGFAYTDCAEVFDDGTCNTYGDTFAFGFGSYREERYRDASYFVTNYPSLNARTVRHIVGMPNHVRAWRRDVYEAIGGYGSEIHVADDYEICLRTFLATRMVHVQRFGYKQHLTRDGANTQFRRNKEIQRLVRLFQERYAEEIHRRFLDLDVDDYLWRDGRLDWTLPDPDPVPIANYVMR